MAPGIVTSMQLPHAHHGSHEQQFSSAAELAGFFVGLPSRPRAALDIGCGSGADAVFLAQLGIDVTGVDASERALELARERAVRAGVEVRWVRADALDLPFEEGSFDLALDRGCLHHIAPEAHGRYAAEVARILKPGGVLLVRELNDPEHHALAVTEDSLRAMVQGAPLRERAIASHDVTSSRHPRRAMLATFVRE